MDTISERLVYDVEMEDRSKYLFDHLFRYASVVAHLKAEGRDKDGNENRRIRVSIPAGMREDFEARLSRKLSISREGDRFRPSQAR